MTRQTSRGILNLYAACTFGLMAFIPSTASAQDNRIITSCSTVDEIAIPLADTKLDDAVKVSVPTNIFNVTKDVYAVSVWCGANSSLRPKDDNRVGSGRTIITSSDSIYFNDVLDTIYLGSDGDITHVIADSLDAVAQKIDVYMCPKPNRELASWTHGECQLGIVYGDDAEDGLDDAGIPRDCRTTEEVEPVALCEYPDSESVSEVKFARAGFYTDGSPAQYDKDGLLIPEKKAE